MIPAIPETVPRSGSPKSTEYDAFVRDDMEFRTITTLLNVLDCREKVTLHDFEVVPKLKPYLKILSALSSLLVRNHEIVAILPKRSRRGIALLIGSDASPLNNVDDYPSPPPSPSLSEEDTLAHYITQNPRHGDAMGCGIEFTESSIITVGSNVDDFIMKNWNQSFEQHVQAFADLLNTAFKTPGPKATTALKRYSTIESASKINRRFTRSVFLGELKLIDVDQHTTQTLGTLTNAERDKITVALYRDKEGQRLHANLYDSLTNPAGQIESPNFVLWHQYFTWLIFQLSHEIGELSTFRNQDDRPDTFPVQLIRSAILHLDILEYLAWESPFFAEYIGTFRLSRKSQEATSGRGIRPTSPIPTEPEEGDEGEDTGGNIWTEFETGEDRQPDANSQPPPVSHPWILELRLITSNVHQLKHLLGRLPLPKPLSFSFKVLHYGRSGQALKPWRELVHELFPNNDEEKEVLRNLENLAGNRNRKYKIFHAKGPELVFRGESHCEAVLGCLYTLARKEHMEDISWANIPRSILQAAENSYGLLAPSKRCCPVCATIISYLQPESGPGLQSLSKHSIVFPCALPIGLPHEVRTRLLHTYRTDLKKILRGLSDRAQSSASTQSQPLSDHDENEEESANLKNRETALEILEDWEGMGMESIFVEWAAVRTKLSQGVAEACWYYMRDDYKLVLAPP